MDVFKILQELHKESAVDTTRKPLVPAEKNNGITTTTRRCRTREVSSRYKSPTPSNSRRCPSPNLTRNANSSLPSSTPKRAVSAERKRPSTPPSPRPSTPVSDTSAESQLLAKKMTGSRLPEVLWPSTMRSLSVSFQSDSISIPVSKKEREKPVTHALSDRTLKSSSNVAQKQAETTASSPRKPTPERKRSPLKGKNNSSHQSENSRPVDTSSQARLIDQHRWPSRTGGKLSANIMTRSVDLTDRISKIPTSSIPSIPRRLSAEGIPRPLHKTSSDASEQSEFDDHIGKLGLRMKSVDDSLLRISARHSAANVPSSSEKATSTTVGAVRSGSSPGSRLPSPSRASISKVTPSPSKTRPSTPTQSRGTSPSRIRPSGPTRQSSNTTTSVLSFIADIKKGKKTNQLEEAHQLRLLYNRHLQWRFANARAEAALYTRKITAEVGIFHLLSLLIFKISMLGSLIM